jgi:hypothetical protein
VEIASDRQADTAKAALRAVGSLLSGTLDTAGPDAARAALAHEARSLFDASVVVVASLGHDRADDPRARYRDSLAHAAARGLSRARRGR